MWIRVERLWMAASPSGPHLSSPCWDRESLKTERRDKLSTRTSLPWSPLLMRLPTECKSILVHFTGGGTEAERAQQLNSGLPDPCSPERDLWSTALAPRGRGELARNADFQAPLWTYTLRIWIWLRFPHDLCALENLKALFRLLCFPLKHITSLILFLT